MITKTITKLLVLTFLIRTMKSQDAKFQDQNHLSKERNLSDDSKNDVDDQKTIEGPTNRNDDDGPRYPKHNNSLLERDSKLNNTETNKTEYQSQKDQDEDSRSNHLDEENISEHPGYYNKGTKLSKHKTSEHDSRNQNHIDKDSQENQNTENKNEDKTLDEDASPSPKSYQRTSKHQISDIRTNNERPSHSNKPTVVTDNSFPYMIAVMKGTTYVSAGALIDESWVLTAAGGIHLMRETIRFLRIRLGSINYKKGGTLLPVKYLEIHPYYNSSMPVFDLALIMLAKPVRYTANLRSIRLQLTPTEVTTTHFIMTSWRGIMKSRAKHHRILSVTHLHPSDSEECVEDLKEIGVDQNGVMCFSGVEDACMRDTGAPVVINGVLWGVISSWKPEDCDDEDFIFTTLVSARNISTWIHATVHNKWHPKFSL